jgi:hypothetical protein
MTGEARIAPCVWRFSVVPQFEVLSPLPKSGSLSAFGMTRVEMTIVTYAFFVKCSPRAVAPCVV